MKHLALIVIAALALAGCAMNNGKTPAGIARPAVLPPPPDPATQMTALESRVMGLVAAARSKIDPKAHALALDPELAGIARARAQDMATKNYLAHAAPNGDTSASLLMAEDAKFQGLLGENLAAQHYVKQSGVDPDAFAQRFLETWLASAPHRENLAYPEYVRTGVGAAVNGDTVYIAQLFVSDIGARPSGDTSVSSLAHPGDAGLPAVPPAPIRLRGAIGAQP